MKKSNSNGTVEERDEESLSLWEVACGVLAAAFGVRSEANKKRDFSRGKPMRFIVIGVVFTVIFLFSVIGLVRLVLSVTN